MKSVLLLFAATCVFGILADSGKPQDGLLGYPKDMAELPQGSDRALWFQEFWQCDRICLFWCHCDGFQCQRDRRMLEETEIENGLTDQELADIEWNGISKLLTEESGSQSHRRDLLFGSCEPPPQPVYNFRFLEEGTFHHGTRRHLPDATNTFQLIDKIGGDPFANFSYHHNMLTKNECNSIIKFIDHASEKDHFKKNFGNSSKPFKFFFVDIPLEDLDELIGTQRVMEFKDAIHSAVGRPVPITRVRGRRMPADPTKHLAYHHDTKKHATLLIELSEEYTGGEIVYLTNEGPVIVERFLGTGVIHGSDIVHGVFNQDGGARYVLHVFSDMDTANLSL